MKLFGPIVGVLLIIAIIAMAGVAVTYLNQGTSTTQDSTSSSGMTTTTTLTRAGTTTGISTTGSDSPVWPTYHLDNSRSGYDPNEPQVGSVRSAWNSSSLDGAIYAEPLIADGMIYVATENNSIYALNENTGAQVWRTNLGTPIPGSSLPCGDIDPSGITGTPVINGTAGAIYAVAYVESSGQSGSHELFSLNLKTGSTIFERNVDPSGADVTVLQQRAALALANGMVYIAYGGLDGDCGNYQGWVIGATANNIGPLVSYQVPTQREGGIWAPSGPTIESSGDLLVAIGNSAATSSTDSFDYGDSVVRLSPTLQVLGYWAPSDWATLNAGDTDVGSISPSLLGGGTVFQSGKDGMGYLLNESNLGGIGGELFSAQVCDSAFGGTAHATPYLFVPCTGGLFVLNVKTGTAPSFTPVWNATGFWAGPPIIAGGAVWTVGTDSSWLYAYSMQSGNLLFQYQLGSVVHFETLSSGGGVVFLADGNVMRAFSM